MKPIKYHRIIGTSKQNVCDFRVDVDDNKYVLRACVFYVEGVEYEIENDQYFSDSDVDQNFVGFITEIPGAKNKAHLWVVSSELTGLSMSCDIGEKILAQPIVVVSNIDGVDEKALLVSVVCDPAENDRGSHKIDSSPPEVVPSKTQTKAKLEKDSKTLIVSRENLVQVQKPIESVWGRLSDSEKQSVMNEVLKLLNERS